VVSVWDNFFPLSKAIFSERRGLEAALNREEIDTLSIEQILPRYVENPYKYCIPHEWHPNAEAHHIFAAYLLDHVINQKSWPVLWSLTGLQVRTDDRSVADLASVKLISR
jgi:hypothetical protein